MELGKSKLPCYHVNDIVNSSYYRCNFVIENDCLKDDALIDYVRIVYCDFSYDTRYLAISLVTMIIVVLFLALSFMADEFLCPSLLAVAKSLRMSDNLAGVTLLAFGNGCPDIFSSIVAAADRPELILSELLGAGIFCTSVVAGFIFIKNDFKLARRPVLRDTAFYLLAVYLIWLHQCSKEITFYKSFAFILIYCVYLVVALSGQAIRSRATEGNYVISEASNPTGVDVNEDWFKTREMTLEKNHKTYNTAGCTDHVPKSDKIEVRNGITTIQLGTRQLEKCHDTIRFSIFEKADITRVSINRSDSNQLDKLGIKEKMKESSSTSYFDEHLDFLIHINPIDMIDWHETNLIKKVANIVKAPLLFVAILTVPVVDNEKKNNNWCRILNSIHCVTVPLTVVISTQKHGIYDNMKLFGLDFSILVLVPGLLMALVVYKTTSPNEVPKFHTALAYLGFLMSITWIYSLASEIISLLETIGIILSLSDAAIGLSFLAWGNSLGDLAANLTLAEAGYPRMALGASIGAPLLNLLLGFGISFTLTLKPGHPLAIEYTTKTTLLCSTLAIILISLMILTILPPEKSKRPFGFLLIICYIIYFIIAVCLEYKIIKW